MSAADQKLSTDNFLRHDKYLILHFMRLFVVAFHVLTALFKY